LKVFVYLLDSFIPLDLSPEEIMSSFEKDPLRSFELVKDIVKRELGEIKEVRFYNSYTGSNGFLIEYLVDFRCGQASVKIICAKDPRKVLVDYYKAEKERADMSFSYR